MQGNLRMLITPPVAWALACDDWVSLYWECLEPEEQSLGIRYAEEIGWQTENGKLTKVGELAVEQIREDYEQSLRKLQSEGGGTFT